MSSLKTVRGFDGISDTSTESDPIENLDPNTKGWRVAANAKHKRSLCRNFTENGFCPYGRKCQFAHGLEELKCSKAQNNSYKTKACYSFEKKGFCMYGVRCNFIHKSTQEHWDAASENEGPKCREIIYEMRKDGASRLIKLLSPSE